MGWEPYNIDRIAHDLILNFRDRGDGNIIKESHKMRMTVAYGLERFWGETLRLEGDKQAFWQATWTALVDMMNQAGVNLPNQSKTDTESIKKVAESLWNCDLKQRKVTLAILTQLCDSMVWWTQRYKH
jgi:hypothetical protein